MPAGVPPRDFGSDIQLLLHLGAARAVSTETRSQDWSAPSAEHTDGMHFLTDIIHNRGGLAATHELLAAGATKHTLAHAVNSDIVIRVRQGWYCTPDVHPLLQQGVRVGGRLGCVSGAALYGMWAPPGENLHVSLGNNDCRLRTPTDKRRRLTRSTPGVTTHWHTQHQTGSRLLLDPLSCLEDVVRCQPIEFTVAIADSALRPGRASGYPLISHSDWNSLIDRFPGRTRQLELADGVCESGTESITWVRFTALRLPLERQVLIDGMRVDFLIGRRLVVEVDGAAYHIDPVRFEADRRRDARLCTLNYIVLRFSYNQVIYEWHEVEAAVLAAVARGDHR